VTSESTFTDLEDALREALTHLYDPLYEIPRILQRTLGIDPSGGTETMRAAIVQALDGLKPASYLPEDAPIGRLHDVLVSRYVQRQTQEDVAEHLSVSSRYVRMLQRKAITALAKKIWQKPGLGAPSSVKDGRERETPAPATIAAGAESASWSSQLREELQSLASTDPGAVANVQEAMINAAELGASLVHERNLTLDLLPTVPGWHARIHPSALAQVLLVAISDFAQSLPAGTITLGSDQIDDAIVITVQCCHPMAQAPSNLSLVEEISDAYGGSADMDIDSFGSCLTVKLPLASPVERITVLVVDDNADLVTFYRAYTTGTRYDIVHVSEGKDALEAIETHAPHVIVLDVMLPDMNGWKLLVHLHAHPTSRAIPIVVCSVIREEELALSLGAAALIPKPVGRVQFIRALDEALSRAP
jgi:CheY-like chemotaxis protein